MSMENDTVPERGPENPEKDSPLKLTVSVAELKKQHEGLKTRSRLWMASLAGAALTSVASAAFIHPGAGIFVSSLYLVLFTHSNLYKIQGALKQSEHALGIFDQFGEEAVNQQIAEQMGGKKPSAAIPTEGQGTYL